MFCPECGASDRELVEGLCPDCYLKNFKILKISQNIPVTVCAHCNAKLDKGTWKEEEIPYEEIVYRALENSIKVSDLAEKYEKKDPSNLNIELEIVKIKGTLYECVVSGKARIFNTCVEQEFPTTVKINKSVCPNCSKRNSGYYESVIQLRADNRQLEEYEIENVNNIVEATLNKLFKKNKLAYLAQVSQLKEGLDYYIGSYKSSKKLANILQEKLGGVLKESPRLISEDKSTGKGLYRIWISLRLASFKKGDFIKYNGQIGEVVAITGQKITVANLDNFKQFTISWKDYNSIKSIGKNENKSKTTVISKSPSNIQILHPETYDAIDIPLTDNDSILFEKINIGDEVESILIENKIYMLH
ncbi:MAG: 60S ribosomal export protein NMD3 [Methanobacteriaceae archaeon]